jgi:hypothetical protein
MVVQARDSFGGLCDLGWRSGVEPLESQKRCLTEPETFTTVLFRLDL